MPVLLKKGTEHVCRNGPWLTLYPFHLEGLDQLDRYVLVRSGCIFRTTSMHEASDLPPYLPMNPTSPFLPPSATTHSVEGGLFLVFFFSLDALFIHTSPPCALPSCLEHR